MKKSKAETALTRQRIIDAAAEQFRLNGIHETGVAELMAAAGLTQGGFYRHFSSKDQLVAEACAKGACVLSTMAAEDQDGKEAYAEMVTDYLSPRHRDDPGHGCSLASLGSELARSDGDTRAGAAQGVDMLLDKLARQFRRAQPEVAKAKAQFALSALIGAMTLSRITTDPDLSASILANVQKYLLDL